MIEYVALKNINKQFIDFESSLKDGSQSPIADNKINVANQYMKNGKKFIKNTRPLFRNLTFSE